MKWLGIAGNKDAVRKAYTTQWYIHTEVTVKTSETAGRVVVGGVKHLKH